MPDMTTGEVAELVTQMLTDDTARDAFYAKVDEAVECIFEPDAAIKKLPYVQNRHHGSTKIADARNSAVRVFSSMLPSININPNNDDEYEYQRVETAEQVLEWEFARMNRIGKKPIHTQLVEDAVTYHAVAFQVEDLEHKYKGQTKNNRLRTMLRQRRFNWVRHHPGTIHSQSSDMGVERVAKVCNYSIQTLIDNFGRDNAGVQKILAKNPNLKPAELVRTKYTLVDYMDWENRIQFAQPASGDTIPRAIGNNSDFTFMNEKHGLPFLPWVVVDNGEPLWKALIQSGQYDNMQYLGLLRFAKAIEQGTRSTLVIKTPDGTLQRLFVDFSNPSNPIVAPLDGTQVEPLPPPPIDPQLEAQYQELSSNADRSTVARILQDASAYINSAFSTFNAATNNAIGQLTPAKSAAEMAEMLGFLKMFEWIAYSDKPLLGYRMTTGDSRVRETEKNGKGSVVGIFPGKAPAADEVQKMKPEEYASMLKRVYFDLDALYITVELRAYNQSDMQSKMNTEILAIEKMGKSKRSAFEDMGWKNYELEKNQRAQETLEDAELQTAVAIKQLKVQEAQMQMQMQAQQAAQAQAAQQQQPQNTVNDLNAANQFASMQGADMRGGGMPAAPAAPNETREQVTGQSAGGGGLA